MEEHPISKSAPLPDHPKESMNDKWDKLVMFWKKRGEEYSKSEGERKKKRVKDKEKRKTHSFERADGFKSSPSVLMTPSITISGSSTAQEESPPESKRSPISPRMDDKKRSFEFLPGISKITSGSPKTTYPWKCQIVLEISYRKPKEALQRASLGLRYEIPIQSELFVYSIILCDQHFNNYYGDLSIRIASN
jgi:hypothetical protein